MDILKDLDNLTAKALIYVLYLKSHLVLPFLHRIKIYVILL